jgi:hypothetical protein
MLMAGLMVLLVVVLLCKLQWSCIECILVEQDPAAIIKRNCQKTPSKRPILGAAYNDPYISHKHLTDKGQHTTLMGIQFNICELKSIHLIGLLVATPLCVHVRVCACVRLPPPPPHPPAH